MSSSWDYDMVILTDERYEAPREPNDYVQRLLLEEELLLTGLTRRGLRAARIAWSRPDFDWCRTRAAVFRSTWDYFDRFAEFSRWMDRATGATRLFNSPALVRWNIDKHYLADLERRGVAIPTTVFLEPGTRGSLAGIVERAGWKEAILKPAVSGAARHTYRLNPGNLAAHEPVFHELVAVEAMLLQPFQERVLTEGEISLVAIDGVCTHAVRKIAKPGDFRVQDDHGGTVHPHTPSADEMAFAEQAVAACPEAPIYARIDVVRDADGSLRLMELEVVEPELFLRFHPPAADALAAALVRHLDADAG